MSMFNQARQALEKLYRDTADVQRNTTSGNVLGFQTVHTGLSCHLSLDSKPVIVQGQQVATAPSQYTAYFAPGADVQEGDRLKITHMGQESWYDVGTVHPYDLNLVCRCTRRGIV